MIGVARFSEKVVQKVVQKTVENMPSTTMNHCSNNS